MIINFFQNICGHKSETIWCMWTNIGMGGEHHRHYKHNYFCRNLRVDSKFFIDLTRNDPNTTLQKLSTHNL